ncbi:MAG TPA: HAD-IB family phosphatase [Candidatus Norongarragalinales archaeon]|jgi:HAD superfamily phosphoserine phosphatase-like hydrolase|nr:HAD-IB family phosphatase [Candidatus Norongarragalinales archaeon]
MTRLVVFDFDGVLSTEDSLFIVAKELGQGPAVAEIVEEYYGGLARAKTKKEREDIANNTVTRVHALLKGFGRWELSQACEKIKPNKGIKEILDILSAEKVRTLVVSGTFEFFVRSALKHWSVEVDDVIATQTAGEKTLGPITFVVGGGNKQELVERFLKHNKISKKEAWAVGDSVADKGLFKAVGKERSIAFNYRPGIERFAGVKLFKQGDPRADLSRIAEFVL